MKIIKRITILFLLLFIILPLVPSCDGNEDLPKETVEQTTTLQADTTQAQPENAVIFKDNTSNYTVVRSDTANNTIVDFVAEFRIRLCSMGNCDIGIGSDYISPKQTYDPASYEILVGETIREESIKLYEDLSDIGFIIRVNGNKLLVGGTDEYMIYCAIGYILNNLIEQDDNSKASLVLSNDYEYISSSDISAPTPEDVIESGKAYAMYPIEKVINLSGVGSYTVLEGGGTDGTYAYYAFLNNTTDTAVITKIDIATWTVVKTSEQLDTGHTNDITYNPKLGLLVVNNSNDSWCGVSYIDPVTLTETEYRVNTISSRGISYIEETDQYVLGGVYDFYITDSQFNLQKQFTCGNPQYTTQGLYCDGTYIYDVRYATANGTNYITINNVNGTYAGTATLDGVSGEPENIFRDGNDFYIAYNKSFVVYRSIILPTSWWE